MLTDTNYPGWRAYLNGRRVPIATANYLFRGVIVPPGKNIVEFAYEPNSFRIRGRDFARGLARARGARAARTQAAGGARRRVSALTPAFLWP